MVIQIRKIILFVYFLVFLLYSNSFVVAQDDFEAVKTSLLESFGNRVPRHWAEVVPGVKTHLDTNQKIIVLTLDACGSDSDGYDAQLIDFLIKEKIPATLFINGRWIDKNQNVFKQLSINPLFEIANHGLMHKPCSVNGQSIYGIAGTNSLGEVIDEVELNARKIQKLTNRNPIYYRSGTAYYDEVAVEAVQKLGYTVIGFSVLGDAGATYSKEETKNAVLRARPGDIIICHMNHPEKESSKGLIEAIRILEKNGFVFAKPRDYHLK